MTQAYPLHWPDGWPRTRPAQRGYLQGGRQPWERVLTRMRKELRLLGAKNVVVSTNQPIRNDGEPYAARRIIDDPGTAVYFELRDRPMVMAQDAYLHIVDNLRSLALAIEHLRGLERHGGGHMMERAFSGFEALPPPKTDEPWHEVFNFYPGEPVDRAKLDKRFRELSKVRHPDNGGDHESMAALNTAYQQAKRDLA